MPEQETQIQVEAQAETQAETQAEAQPSIQRGRVDSLILYEVKEGELEIIKRGSPYSVYLNYAIFSLSIAVAFLIALLTTTIQSDSVRSFFIAVCFSGFVIGSLLVKLSYDHHGEFNEVIKKIEERVQRR